MGFAERASWLLLGMALGFVLGFIVARLRSIEEKVNTMDEHVSRAIRKDNERGAVRLEWRTLALMFVVLLTAYSAVLSQVASNKVQDAAKDDKVSLCQAGVSSRAVQRELVEAIYVLATGSLQRDREAPPLTEAEIRMYNAYIDRVNKFRKEMYQKIKPTKVCVPYVDDENIAPPSDPYPSIETPKEPT